MAKDLKTLVGAGRARELQDKLEKWHQDYEVGSAAPRGRRQRPPLGVRCAGRYGPPTRTRMQLAQFKHLLSTQLRLFGFLSMARFPENKGRRLKVRFEAY